MNPSPSETIRKFDSAEAIAAAGGQVARATWRSEQFKTHLVFRIEGPKIESGKRLFMTIELLHNGQRVDVPYDYPHIPLTPEQAEEQTAHLRQLQAQPAVKPQQVELGAPPPRLPAEAKEDTMAKETTDSKPTLYSVLAGSLRKGETKDQAVAAAKAAFTDAEDKKVKAMVHSIAAQLKRAAVKASAPAAPAEPAAPEKA